MKCASSVACEMSDTFLIYGRKALFTLILTVQQSSNWKLFFCFPEDGAITQGFGLFYWTDSPCYTLSLSTSSAREVAPATTTIPASGSVSLGCEAPLACFSFSSASKLISILFWWLAVFSCQVGCTSTTSLSPMSAQFCTLQITFFLLVASGGGQAMTPLDPHPPLRSYPPTSHRWKGGFPGCLGVLCRGTFDGLWMSG